MPSAALVLIASAVFGAIIGSFLNALSFRFNTGRGFLQSMGGRSHCMHCGHTLDARDLVPIFSFLYLRGSCRWCGSKISWQYPLVEALAALLSVCVILAHPTPLGYAFWMLVWMTLLFIGVYDIKHTIIPWSCSGFLAILAVTSLFISFNAASVAAPGLWAILAGPLLALPLFLLSLVSGGRWMGWGDSALELGLGWLLGLTMGLTAFMLAFWSGALVGVVLLVLSRLKFFRFTIQSEIPFAPFLIFGAAVAHFFHVDFFSSLYGLF